MGGLPNKDAVTVAHITDCPTIMVHAGKHYKSLIDSEATILLLRYSTYKKIADCYKTPIQPTTAKLNTADGLPMSALGSTTLHVRIAKFKFTHNFIICNQLPETELILGIDIQRKFSLSYVWDKERNATSKKMENFWFTHTPMITRQQ